MRRLTALFVLLTVLPATVAQAEPYPVTSAADSGAGSLRAAINAANGRSGPDSIPIVVTGTITLETALPPILDDVTIAGAGAAALTLERKPGAAAFRILTFADTADGGVSGVTIRGGSDPLGAGILSETASLTLTGVVVVGNEARAEGGSQAVARGGGVASFGPLVVRESTIESNAAVAEDGTSQTLAAGGGIASSGVLSVERSTVSGNLALALGELGGSIVAQGGGMKGGQLTLTSSTVTGNEIISDQIALGANLEFTGGTLVRDTIVADARGDDEGCSGPQESGGFNLDEDGSCGFGQGSDLVGVAAGLDPVLRDNGGPTPTHALLAGSIAIDRGNAFGATRDQRGLPRPSDFATISNKEGGDGSDIGAFELQAPPTAVPVLVSAVPADRHPPNTRFVSGPSRLTFDRLAKFRFASTEPQSTFQCKLDKKKRWRSCANPFKRTVKPGKHLFRVRAIDRFGNVDPTPARFGWRVKPLS